MLGLLYCEGDNGVPRDYVRACCWMDLAARTSESAQGRLPGIISKMKPEELAAAKKQSEEWKARIPVLDIEKP